ncbi:hypothetical protein CKO29_06900 [Allochromatium vinosum]|nr:hypothetical protein [Allochromatium vinosum]
MRIARDVLKWGVRFQHLSAFLLALTVSLAPDPDSAPPQTLAARTDFDALAGVGLRPLLGNCFSSFSLAGAGIE